MIPKKNTAKTQRKPGIIIENIYVETIREKEYDFKNFLYTDNRE